MPTIRSYPDKHVAINEWTLDEVSRAFETEPHPLNKKRLAEVNEVKRGKAMASNPQWYGGCRTLDQVRSLLVNGWHEGVERLESLIADINPPQAQTRKRRPEWRDEGDELNVERALRGQWDNAWRSARRVWTSGPQTVELYSIYGGAASLTPEQIFWNGAACVALADRLESAGYSVRIVACFLHDDGRSTVRSDVIVKEAHEPLRIDAVASIMCHAGVYRTFLFRTWVSMPLVQVTEGLGPACYSFAPYVVERLKSAGEWPEGAIVVDQAYDRATCERRIEQIMAKVQESQA